MDKKDEKTNVTGKAIKERQQKKERLAASLKANLKRRKKNGGIDAPEGA